MDFTAMDARAYRSLNADQYETRRSLVLSLAEELPEDATEEQMRSIDEELGYIKAEDARRDSMVELRNHKAAAIIGGAGKVVETTEAESEPEKRSADTLGDHFVNYVKERGHEKSFHLVAPAYRAATDIHVIPSGATPAITTYDKNVVTGKRVPMNVLDLLNREVIEGNTLMYFVEGAMEGTPAVTAEAAKKPQVHFAFDQKTVTLQKIAAFIKESDEMIDDANFLASAINGRLLYELNFVRQATVISALLGTSGIQTATWPSTPTFTDISLDIADAVAAAAADVQEESGFAADAVVITPTLWKQLRTGHLNDGAYVGGGYFEQGAAPTLWGLPIAVSSQLTAGHILVGAFGTCASLVTKSDGVTVESTNTDQDDFVKNLMTIRAEVREVLAVRRPAGFVDLTVSGGGDISA